MKRASSRRAILRRDNSAVLPATLTLEFRAARPSNCSRSSGLLHPWKLRNLWRDAGLHRRGSTLVVYDIEDLTVISQRDGDHVMESHSGFLGHFDRPTQIDVRLNEYAIDAEAPSFVARDGVRNLVGDPSVDSGSAGIARLIRGVIRNLGLIEVRSSSVSIPQHLKLLVMFDEQAVNRHVVSVNDEPLVARVAIPTDTFPMICPPDPCVIDNHTAAVDAQIDGCAPDPASAHAEKHVV